VGNRFLASGAHWQINGCTGTVAFHEIATSTWPHAGWVDIVNCAQVSFTSCSLGLTWVTNSRATFTAVDILPNGGSPSLHIFSGSVSIAASTLSGGIAASWYWHDPGIVLDQGDLVVTGATRITESPAPAWSGHAPAIATSGGTLRMDPSVVLIGTPPISGPAAVTFAATPSLAVVRAPGSPSYQVNVTAEPASLVFTLLGLPAPVLPLPWGDAWLDPVSPILDVTVAPPSGTWSFTRSLAAVPPFLVLVVQSAALSPNNTIVISPPVRFVWD
jgi:hypothetical protein